MTDLTATGLPLDNTADTAAEQYDPAHDYHALNAMLNLYDADGKKVDNTTEAAAIQSSTNGVMTAVANDETAIGYISLGSLSNDVKAVTVGGVEASAETVKDGSYEVQRPFVFVTNKSVTLSEQAQAFFDFATSADAADLIRTAGAVPVNE